MASVTKTVHLTGQSEIGIEDAIRTALARAQMTLQDIEGFEVTKIDGRLSDAGDWIYRVHVSVTFVVKEKFLHE